MKSDWWGLLILMRISFSLATLPSYRLPQSIRPSHYTISIITHLEPELRFEGEVWIKVDCNEPTSSITLHSNNLKIDESEVCVRELLGDEEGDPIRIVSQSFETENDFFKIELGENLTPGKRYMIYIPYAGDLYEGMAGYYKSSYFEKSSNKTRWMAVTQFESTDARRAFPCFDEPGMKARFTLRLAHRKDLKSLSNMPLCSTMPMGEKEGWVWDLYQETVKMSTYLVAFFVGDVGYKTSPPRPNNVVFKTWARRDALEQASYAQEVGPRILEFYEEFFGIKYPLPKADMVAIPDFSAGAMENWGLITYREASLLWDEVSSSSITKTNVAYTVAHELAHQWFGNLVTMKWWSDLWLNEGFATHIGNLGVDHVYPEWNWLMIESVKGSNTVLKLDCLNSSHPVIANLDEMSKIGQIFDAISYQKGAALSRMMNHYLTKHTIQKGLTRYLKKFQYSNAEQDDLWDSLTQQAHEDNTLGRDMSVKMIMDSWTRQTGYPLITVTRDYDTGETKITQERYMNGDLRKMSWKECWWVPLSYTTQDAADFTDTHPKAWLNCADKNFTIRGLPSRDQWVIFNLGFAGLYRVTYDELNWKLISKTLNSDRYSTIGTANRATILLDSFELAASGDIDYAIPFENVKYLKREKEYIPWMAGFDSLAFINTMIRRTSGYSKFKEFMKQLIEPIYKRYGGLDHCSQGLEETHLHQNIMSWSLSLGLGTIKEDSVELFEKWMSQPDPDTTNPIKKDVRRVVYCSAVKSIGEKAWNFLWQRYRNSNSGHDQVTLIVALGCSRDKVTLKKYLELSITPSSGIRKQDSTYVFSAVLADAFGFSVAKDFLFNGLERIYKYHGSRSGKPGKLMSMYADNIANSQEKDEFVSLIEQHRNLISFSYQDAMQSVERAKNNAKWTEKYLDHIMQLI